MLKNLKIKKIIPYFFILLIVLVGFFGAGLGVQKAEAVKAGDPCTALEGVPGKYDTGGTCVATPTAASAVLCTGSDGNGNGIPAGCTPKSDLVAACVDSNGIITSTTQPCASGSTWNQNASLSTSATATAAANADPLTAYLNKKNCGFSAAGIGNGGTIWPGCALQISQGLFIAVPGLILSVTAYFFNFLASITLYSNIYSGSTFIPVAWGVVRDLSNIFFILILLYIAVRLILGLGGHDVKQMVGKVIIIALLINFSMFFTEVVIDSSNILALIFYNKMSVTTTTTSTTGGASTTTNIPYASVGGEKDIASGMVAAFNPLTLIGPVITQKAGIVAEPGQPIPTNQTAEADPSTVIGMMLLAGAIMCFAAYAFFIAGLSFLGRMIELFTLIIFSPFAFMSFTIPKLKGLEDLGWDSWSKSLIRSAFMAPIFMFFMYFIFLLVHANMFGTLISNTGTGAAAFLTSILYVIIPAIFILVLLLKAAKFAKKGSGVIGEYIFKGASVVGGLALTAASGGAGMALKAASSASASAGRATVGRAGAAMANSSFAKKWEAKGYFGETFRKATSAVGSASFDVRGAKIGGKTLASATGLNVGEAKKGGFTERRKEDVEKRQKRAESLTVGEDETLKQELNKTEDDLQDLLNTNSLELSNLDKLIEDKRKALTDANAQFGGGTAQATQAGRDLENAKNRKAALRNGLNYAGDMNITTGAATTANAKNYTTQVAPGSYTYVDANGVSQTVARTIKNMETIELVNRKHEIEAEDRERLRKYSKTTEGGLGRFKNFVFSGGQHSYKGSKEAAHKIRMGAKVETKK